MGRRSGCCWRFPCRHTELGLAPELVEFGGVGLLEGFEAGGGLHLVEAGAELLVGLAEGELGLEVKVAGEVDGGEEEVAELVFGGGAVKNGTVDLGAELGCLFG